MKKIIIIFALIGLVQLSKAQTNNAFNLYATNPFLINPSLVGAKANTNIFTHYRNQFSGFAGAPVSQVLSLDHKLSDRKFGLGLQVYNQSAGILSQNGLQVAYAYNAQLNEDWNLNFGLAANFSQRNINFSDATVFENEPSVLEGNIGNTVFDGNFGISIQNENLIVGISIPNIMQSNVGFEDFSQSEFLSLQNRRAYELFVDYSWELSEKVKLEPVAMLRQTTGGLLTYDLAAFVHYNKFVFAGLSYQSAYSASVSAGLKITEGFTLAYNYSYPLNDIALASVGGHEIALGYSFSPSALADAKGKKKGAKGGTENEDIIELKEQIFEQSKMNIRQREELARLKEIMKDNNVEEDLQAIKDKARKDLENPLENSIYYVVIGAFTSLDVAQDYQKLLLRNEPSTRTAFAKSGNWILVYAEKRTDAAGAKKAVLSVEQSTLSVEKPWIYVSKI